jgi:ADP-ribose pyrophosphatase YjhB (NUDIX family)
LGQKNKLYLCIIQFSKVLLGGDKIMGNVLYIVNVEAAIYFEDKWLIIKRSDLEEHAPGELSLVGGKVENVLNQDDVLEETLTREIKEEVGVEIYDQPKYIESKVFTPVGCKPIVDIVFMCKYKSGEPKCLSRNEVSDVFWLVYLKDSIRKAEKMRLNMG